MKLLRFGKLVSEKPGIQLDNGQKIDVSAFGEDFDENFFGSNGIQRLQKWLEHHLSLIHI